MAIPRQKRTLRILCFGDSLTAGFYNSGNAYQPYEEAMRNKLSKAFPNLQIDATEDGEPGDLVSNPGGHFLRRMEKNFPSPPPTKKGDGSGSTPSSSSQYDWAIVLGGTNDLAYMCSPEQIYAALQQTWAIPLARGVKVLALTVPEAGVTGPARDKLDARRNKLNELIKAHKADNFHVFDFNAVFPFFNMRPEEREKYWDDHIHFTADGYDLMGERIAAALINIIMPPGRLQMNGERARKRKFKDDDKTFEEEQGDDASLDHGYIVVRRKDLD